MNRVEFRKERWTDMFCYTICWIFYKIKYYFYFRGSHEQTPLPTIWPQEPSLEGLVPVPDSAVWRNRNSWPGSPLKDHRHRPHEVRHAPDSHSRRQQLPHVHQGLLASVASPPPGLCSQQEAAAGHLERTRRKPSWLLPPGPRPLVQAGRCYSSAVAEKWPTAWSGLVPMKANSWPSRTL